MQRQLDDSPRRNSGLRSRLSFASTRLTEEELPAPRSGRTRSSVDSRRGPRLQSSKSGLTFDDLGNFDGS